MSISIEKADGTVLGSGTNLDFGDIARGGISQVEELKVVNNFTESIEKIIVEPYNTDENIKLYISDIDNQLDYRKKLIFDGPIAAGESESFYLKLITDTGSLLGAGSTYFEVSYEK